ncbi:MAG: efflux RND transporter periplasmic adaptor subunit [Lysobacterales bacterium]
MARWKLALSLVGVVLLAVIVWRVFADRGERGGSHDNEAPVPVTVVPVVRENVPIYLTATGTVQALNTVTVNAQVTGQLKSIVFTEGEEVKQGDVIAEIDPRTFQAALEQAQGKQRQDQAQLVASRSTLKRYEELIGKHFVAAQDLENQRQTVSQQEAMVAADQAAVDSAKVQLGYTTIRAPITGIAGIRQVDVGNIVQAGSGSGIVVLTQVHPINVLFNLPEQNLDAVRTAQAKAPLVVAATDSTDGRVLSSGVLKVIDNQIDPSTGTFKLKAEFRNEGNSLWPGQYVNVRMTLRTDANAMVVPATAVQRGPEGAFVYVVGKDDAAQMKPVATGAEAGSSNIVVTSGLDPADRVVTEGQFRIKPGSKLHPLKPGETAPVAPPPAAAAGAKRSGHGG